VGYAECSSAGGDGGKSRARPPTELPWSKCSRVRQHIPSQSATANNRIKFFLSGAVDCSAGSDAAMSRCQISIADARRRAVEPVDGEVVRMFSVIDEGG